MVGTYVAALAVCAASLAFGQAAIALCGGRRWSWLAPPVGLALLLAICWGTVRMPGAGVATAAVVGLLLVAAVVFLRGRVAGGGEALRAGWPVALAALLAISLPFAVGGHFGILGTGFNPDMSQHLLATDRLAGSHGSSLLVQGYPLGPHAIVVALHGGLGIGLVQGFDGLTAAVAILTCLTALAGLAALPAGGAPRRSRRHARTALARALLGAGAALAVGLAYLPASYLAQGAFKETMQALMVLAFALALREADRNREWGELTLRYVPAALIAVGSAYAYSFPGLLWLAGTAVLWLIASAAGGGVAGGPHGAGRGAPEHRGEATATGPASRALGLALLAFAVLLAPELGRMIDFHSFETFDPNGPGLGNLFGQVSPLEVLGIWPSGDFRLAAGDGVVPAPLFYLGAGFGLALLLHGVWRLARGREVALLAGLAAAGLAYLAARLAGTPYTAAKALAIAAPPVSLAILLPLLRPDPTAGAANRDGRRGTIKAAAATLFVLAALGCSALALANAPVGPTSYSPALTALRPLIASGSSVYVAAPGLLADDHGRDYLRWELRGGRVCIETEGAAAARGAPPPGVRWVIAASGPGQPPFPGLRVRRLAPPYTLWKVERPIPGRSPCPLIAVRQARRGAGR